MNDDERLETFIESLEELVISLQTRLEKVEKEQEAAAKSAPFHLSMPMREFAERPSVGFRWPDMLPIRLDPLA